jgi:hemolysin-activating ACP:hemolysin acyltransferase
LNRNHTACALPRFDHYIEHRIILCDTTAANLGLPDRKERLMSKPPTSDRPTSPATAPDVASSKHAIKKPAVAVLGELCSLLLLLPRYRYVYLSDLEWLLMAPLARNQLSIVSGAKDGKERFVGGVLWARVSAEVDQRIRAQVQAAVFPVRLRPEDWTSGDITWLLDVLAPSRPLATKILSEIGRAGLGGARKLNVHPVVQRLVDPELLRAMGAKGQQPKAAEQSKKPG